MSTDNDSGVPYIEMSGTHYDIGVQLGRFGAEFTHSFTVPRDVWRDVMSRRADPRVETMRRMVETRFPSYWQEMQGLAQGLELPFDDVLLWHFRGDISDMAPEGCTTVQIPGSEPVVAHNEDGAPAHRGCCALAHVRPVGGKAFTSLAYPSTIPGHAFAATETGLVVTINHIRSFKVGVGFPRIVLARALLDCATLDEAVRLLETSPRAGAYHITLAQRGDSRLFGVEFSHSSCSVRKIAHAQCHTNHLIHRGLADEPHEISASSRSRLQRADEIISSNAEGRPLDPLSVLWDKSDPLLPIYRGNPGDHANTVATAVFHVGKKSIKWSVYERPGAAPCFSKNDA
jgi:predicted choloylglycine hydrolase